MADWDVHSDNICRVCRSEGAPDKPLFHPCVCTGSIKFIHQECLVQWLKYSRKEFCELCNHRFSFTPIYSPDMPKRLPFQDIITGLLKSIGRAVRYWFHYTLVAFAWLGVVPLMACRIYRSLFTGSVSSLLTLPLDMLSTENLATDCLQGCFVVTCTLCAFISLVWLREQILHGGGPDWLDNENQQQRANGAANQGGAAGAGANQNAANGQGAANQDGAEEEDGEEEAEEDENEVNNQQQDEVNWNPIEWDRAAEELTWERLLGLDGSLVFLEHVFWVVSLNTLFILVFAFCPYHIGHFTIMGIKVNELVQASQFEGLVTTLTGYTVIAVSLVVLHALAALVKFNKSKRIIGLCYLVVKVALLVVVEIGMFPLICGWWLDICSLAMFDATLKDREKSFATAPGTSMFIHWLVGMVYVFYFASFILLLREVLRPGVLWFLRNLNDPDFNPIQEMIHLPVLRHVRRFLASMVIFGTTVLLMLWLPVQLIKKVIPGFLPYHIMLSSDAPVSELSLELLLLQVVLPALLEQGHTRTWLKGLVRGWTVGVAWLLDLKSYLLGDTPEDTDAAERVVPNIIVPVQHGHQAAELAMQEEGGDQVAAQPGQQGAAQEEDLQVAEDVDQQGAALAGAELDQQGAALGNALGQQGAVFADADIDQQGAAPAGDQLAQQEAAPSGGIDQQGAAPAGDQLAQQEAAPAGGIDQQWAAPANGVDQQGAAPAGEELGQQEAAPANGIDQQGAVPAGGNLGAIHQALLHHGGPSGYQPFHKPNWFLLRMVLLFIMMWTTLFLASLVTLILPVFFGRLLMSLWMGSVRIHELYTAACGLYVCWVVLRLGAVLYQWIPQGWAAIMNKVKEWTLLALKSLMIAFLLIGVAPLLLGLLFELVVVAPLRVPLNQTPVFFPWQDWALGVLHAKIICAVTMMGPQWWLKNVMEQVYNDGLRNMNLTFILTNLCIPVIGCLSMSLAAPYVVAKSIVPMFGVDFETENLVYRRIYPSLLTLVTCVGFCILQIKQFKKLYEHIKNDKYLVGQRLVNYTKPES